MCVSRQTEDYYKIVFQQNTFQMPLPRRIASIERMYLRDEGTREYFVRVRHVLHQVESARLGYLSQQKSILAKHAKNRQHM
ncbi:hypothetical protein YQE_00569, partial [Dendroctonus ponderosae]